MQNSPAQSQLRHRIRSFKYSISRKTSQTKHDLLGGSTNKQKKDSIINIDKLGTVLKMKSNSQNKQNQTIAVDIKKEDNIYVRTFTTFFSRNSYRADQQKQNIKYKILIPQYNHQFDQNTSSDFTFLDTMARPVKYIDGQLLQSEKQLRRQRNDVLMLRAEINALKNNMNQKICQMQAQIGKRLEDLRDEFQRNSVLQNERRLRNKRDLKILQKGHELDSKMAENLKERNLQIQHKIFDCHPLQLEFKQTTVLQINENEYL